MDLAEAKKKFPPIWVIYDHPKDFPDSVVVRIWWGEVPDTLTQHFLSVDAARRHMLYRGRVPLARDKSDDPCIVESWI